MLLPFVLVALTGCRHDEAREEERVLPTKERVLLTDDFAGEENWYAGSDQESETEYVDGRYRTLVKEGDWYISNSYAFDEVVEAMRVDIDAVQEAGIAEDEVGVVCYAHVSAKVDAGYIATVSPVDRSAFVARVLEGDTTVLATRSNEDAIRPLGETNHLRVDCVGAERDEPAVIVLHVNGERVARAEDDDGFPRFDGVGVTTESTEGGTEAFYDDIAVRELR